MDPDGLKGSEQCPKLLNTYQDNLDGSRGLKVIETEGEKEKKKVIIIYTKKWQLI